jgi:hypothetical protein
MAVRFLSLCAGRPLPTGRFLVLISARGCVDPKAIVRLEELGKLKNPVASGIEPATIRLVTQCFIQLRYRVSSAATTRSQLSLISSGNHLTSPVFCRSKCSQCYCSQDYERNVRERERERESVGMQFTPVCFLACICLQTLIHFSLYCNFKG